MKTYLSFAQVVNEQAEVKYAVGSKGEEVKKIQQKLIDLGLLTITNPTGVFGEKTKAAVEEFQRKNPPLTADGVVGSRTYPKLMGSKTKTASTEKEVESTKKKSTTDESVETPAWFTAIPPNIKQMVYPKQLSNSNFTKSQLTELWNAIQASRKRLGGKVMTGATKYIDFGPEYDKWFDKDDTSDLGFTKMLYLSTTNPKFVIATTLGQGTWKIDPNNPDIIHYTDRYNWNKKRQGLARFPAAAKIKDSELEGLNSFQKWNYLRTKASPQLNYYEAFRELQHRNSPVGEQLGPEMNLTLNKKELGIT
jgi:peptidoglycan hydrolase-like protein with peptidoglycan-binding domain